MQLLYYVAVPLTEEILNLATLFAIRVSNLDINDGFREELGLFIYRSCLAVESIDENTEWLLDTKDAIQVLAFYANKDFNSVCEYLNNLPDKPFTVCVDQVYLNHRI